MVCAARLAAQGEAPEFERPAYQLLRQNEDWSGLAGLDRGRTGDWFDPVKYVPLDEDGSVWASFGGLTRLRLESWHDFDFGAPPGASHDDTYLLTRVMVHGDLHLGDHVRVFGELKSAHSTDRDLPGGRRAVDSDEADVQQAFVDLEVPVSEEGSLTVRSGRQMMAFGVQRLVSPGPWSNSLRTWDGVWVILETPGLEVTGFWTQFVPPRNYRFNEPDHGVDFYGGYATVDVPATELGCDLYFLVLSTDVARFNGTSGEQDRYTTGTRVWGDLGAGFDVDVEGAWQVGTITGSRIDAWMVAVEAGRRFEGFLDESRVFAGLDWASGDDSPGGDVQTFSQLFARGHHWLGYVDAIGRQNIWDVRGGLSCRPAPGLEAQAQYHSFWLDSTDDALYNAGGVPTRPASAIDTHYVGGELDLVAVYRWQRHVALTVGYSHFFAGDVLEESGSSRDVDFVYTELQVTL